MRLNMKFIKELKEDLLKMDSQTAIDYKKNEVINIDDNEVLSYNYKTYKTSKDFFMGKEEIDVGFRVLE